MKKRAQISIFIIIGLLLVIISILFFFLSSGSAESKTFTQVQTTTNTKPIQSFVQDCVDKQLPIAIFKLGIHGGYMEPEHVYSGDFFDTSYLYYIDKNLSPTIDDLEHSISFYMDNTLPTECSLEIFEFHDIKVGEIKTTTQIGSNKVLVDIDWPIIIKNNDETTTINEFSSSHDINLKQTQSLVKEIVEKQSQDPDLLDIYFYLSPGYNISMVPDNNDNDLVYFIKDLESEVLDEPFMFIFAMKFE